MPCCAFTTWTVPLWLTTFNASNAAVGEPSSTTADEPGPSRRTLSTTFSNAVCPSPTRSGRCPTLCAIMSCAASLPTALALGIGAATRGSPYHVSLNATAASAPLVWRPVSANTEPLINRAKECGSANLVPRGTVARSRSRN
ncbi:hypothetical protein Lesp01_81770 [Lentzea sp. NBRC 102530]|nr:hypothetical protein Lesp01_81770 [Lentzea sp. NBRC 102530]